MADFTGNDVSAVNSDLDSNSSLASVGSPTEARLSPDIITLDSVRGSALHIKYLAVQNALKDQEKKELEVKLSEFRLEASKKDLNSAVDTYARQVKELNDFKAQLGLGGKDFGFVRQSDGSYMVKPKGK